MRTTLCTLAFLLSLPRSLNGHLTTSHKNIESTNSKEDASGQSDYTIDSTVKNVVSLSKGAPMLHLTSHTEQRGILQRTLYGEDEESNQRTKLQDYKHNPTTWLAQLTIKEEVRAPEKELQKRIESSSRMHTSMQTDDSSKTTNATRADVSPVEKTSRGASENSFHVSRSIQKQDFTHHSKQHSIHLRSVSSEEMTANQTTKRNIVSTIETQPKRQILQSEMITQESSQILHTTFVLQNASEFKTTNAKQASNWRTKRDIHEDEDSLYTTLVQTKGQTTEKKLTTPQKEEGQSSHKPHTTSLQAENASELNSLTKLPGSTRADEKKTTRRWSLLRNFQTQDSTRYSEQRGISLRTTNSEDHTSNQRTKRNLPDRKHNSTTMERQTTQGEVTTHKEQHKPTESSHKPQTTTVLWTESSSEFDVSSKPPNTTSAEEKKTSKGPSEIQETQETQSISIGPDDAQATNNTNGELNKTHPTMETTAQPGTLTHAHTSSAITATTEFNKGVSTKSLKTTERKDIKWTSTQGPELRTSTMIKSTKNLLTTDKTNKSNPPKNQKSSPGPAVAAVIGTTFFLMFIAIIFILAKKHKMQKRQQENPEWAGPSPFLDGDVQPNLTNMDEPEGMSRQGFSQMSIGRYLPSRLSKHFTHTSDEVLLGDIMQGSTFGRQAADEVQVTNGNPKVSQDPTESEQNKTQEDQKPVDSSDTKTNVSESAQDPVMENKESKQTDDVTASLTSERDTKMKHPPPLVSIDLDSLSEETAPFQTSDGGIIPPAPPLP